MATEEREVRRYSEAFQRKVVSEIESGKHTQEGARKLYDIGGAVTIRKWIIKHGKNHLLAKVVRIEMIEDQDKRKQTEADKKELERALGQAHLKIMYLEAVIAEYKKIETESGKKKK